MENRKKSLLFTFGDTLNELMHAKRVPYSTVDMVMSKFSSLYLENTKYQNATLAAAMHSEGLAEDSIKKILKYLGYIHMSKYLIKMRMHIDIIYYQKRKGLIHINPFLFYQIYLKHLHFFNILQLSSNQIGPMHAEFRRKLLATFSFNIEISLFDSVLKT